MLGVWSRSSNCSASRPCGGVPPWQADFEAVVVGPYRGVLLCRDSSCLHCLAVPRCVLSRGGVPARLRSFFHSLAAFEVGCSRNLGGIGGNLRRNWLSRLHAAANRTAARRVSCGFHFLFLLHGITSHQVLGFAGNGSHRIWRRCIAGPARMVSGIAHSRDHRSFCDGRRAVRLLVDRYRWRLQRASNHRNRCGSAFPHRLLCVCDLACYRAARDLEAP